MKTTFICMQCALKAFVESLERGEDPITDAYTPVAVMGDMAEHVATLHADPVALDAERRDLEARAAAGFELLKRKKRALADAAVNN